MPNLFGSSLSLRCFHLFVYYVCFVMTSFPQDTGAIVSATGTR